MERKRWADAADLKRCIFRSRRRTTWWEFSARLFLRRPCSWRAQSPRWRPAAAVGAEPIGDEHARRIALLPEELAHQPQGGGLLPLGLDEQVEDLALAVDGSPQIHTPAPDRDDHLVQVPGIGRSGRQPAQVPGESRLAVTSVMCVTSQSATFR
jgi:hypothetical protein